PGPHPPHQVAGAIHPRPRDLRMRHEPARGQPPPPRISPRPPRPRPAALGGVGPAVLSTLAVADHLASGELRTVEVEGLDLARTLRAVWRPPRKLAGPAGDLVRMIVRGA
ncbi:LysR substrate-binding domain-containing protein, partial [Rhodococcus aetherivorans]